MFVLDIHYIAFKLTLQKNEMNATHVLYPHA